MAIKKLVIDDFLKLAQKHPVIDVRSPGEYNHAHIPGAYSMPLFTNEERAVVGTLYKKVGKQKAIKAGLDFFGVKMKSMVEEVEKIKEKNSSGIVLVHCWRGGMRSAGVAWLLDLYGYEVYTLTGGYKAFRKWVLERFDQPYKINILGGYTGSAKTALLHALRKKEKAVIDLEDLAGHKGSAFGGIGLPEQPSQEMFENKLALALNENHATTFWLEDESQRIGKLHIPHTLWATIRKSPLYFMDVPFHERHQYIIQQYGRLEMEKLISSVVRIKKRFGPNETKITINYLIENDIPAAFEMLLRYYDKEYHKSMHNRENLDALLYNIQVEHIDADNNAELLLTKINT